MNEPANSNPGTIVRPMAGRRVANDHEGFRTALSVIVISVVAVIALSLVLAPSPPSSASPSLSTRSDQATSKAVPSGLSTSGKLLYRFEELLHQRYGTTPVSVIDSSRRKGVLEFVACSGGCTPLALYDPYFFTFTRQTGSPGLSVSSRSVSALRDAGQSFGNYGVPVVMGGHLIVCKTSPTRFLIVYADAVSFTLGCVSR